MTQTLAVVMGDIDLVQAFALAGIPTALFTEPGNPARLSRRVEATLPWVDHWREPERVVETLMAFAGRQAARPHLMPQTDGDLFVVSRHRHRLAERFDFALAAPQLVEGLADKAAFAAMAERLELPAPAALAIDPRATSWRDVDLRPPLVVKPLLRDNARWTPVEPSAKAIRVATTEELEALWPRLVELDLPVLAQEAIDGPETRVESYHAYVDAEGAVAGEFTGRKIRTRPALYGHSCALEITDEPDVRALGREILERLELRGVAKADFKRAPDGRLWLLEVNPRATLWFHPAAIAGVNLAEMVHADLVGRPRPPAAKARAGVRWVLPSSDVRAARTAGVSLGAWLRFAARCEAISGFSARDPFPLVPGALWSAVHHRLPTRG